MRATNAELIAELRHLLTHGYAELPHVDRDRALAESRQWRGALWALTKQIEERLCPQPPRPKCSATTEKPCDT